MDNRVGIDCGSRAGRQEQWGKNWDNCNRTTIKLKKEKYGLKSMLYFFRGNEKIM